MWATVSVIGIRVNTAGHRNLAQPVAGAATVHGQGFDTAPGGAAAHGVSQGVSNSAGQWQADFGSRFRGRRRVLPGTGRLPQVGGKGDDGERVAGTLNARH
jgi:hypothetical protein